MLPHQTAGLGTEFKNGERRGVVDVQRGTDELIDALVELSPLIGLKLAAFERFTLDFAHVDNQTVH